MLRLKLCLQTALACSTLFAALVLAGCEPHHHHSSWDDDDDDFHWSSGGSSGGGGSGGGPSGLPDLRDDGSSFQYYDASAIPGRFFSAGGDVRNDGSAGSGGFWVDFYASTNTLLTTSDFFIGSVYVGGIASGSYANADLLVAFPSIPPGVYYVGWILDASNAVVESSESNNVVLIAGSALLVEDEFEPNDSSGSAEFLGGPATTYTLDATISTGSDEDWFSFTQDAGFTIDVLLSSLPDDYDLEIYADDGTLLDSSTSGGTTSESVTFFAPYTGFYFVRVVGFGSAHDETNTYSLDVNLE